MLITDNHHKIMEELGWVIECESPLEIRHEDGSFCTGPVAKTIIELATAPKCECEWQPIETAPEHGMYVIVAIDAHPIKSDPSYTYTTDPYCTWKRGDGTYSRWEHPFPPTHWFPLPPRK